VCRANYSSVVTDSPMKVAIKKLKGTPKQEKSVIEFDPKIKIRILYMNSITLLHQCCIFSRMNS